jgi:hypothetical protein
MPTVVMDEPAYRERFSDCSCDLPTVAGFATDPATNGHVYSDIRPPRRSRLLQSNPVP